MPQMKNLIVWVRKEPGTDGIKWFMDGDEEHGILLRYLRAQIDNSLEFNWRPEDIVLVTNFDFEYRGVKALRIRRIHRGCGYANKWYGLQQAWEDLGHETHFWMHDQDVWQLSPFEFPDQVADMGFVLYRFGVNTGSLFIRPDLHDLVDTFVVYAENNKITNDERIWNSWHFGKHVGSRLTELNPTYNVGACQWWNRYRKSDRPVRAYHFKPHLPTELVVDRRQMFRTVLNFLTPRRLRRILTSHELWHPVNNIFLPYSSPLPIPEPSDDE